MCFVFRYFLASFPLFFIFCSSLHSAIAGTVPLSLAPGARLRQCVHKMTTIIGYRREPGLSSKKCKKRFPPAYCGSVILSLRKTCQTKPSFGLNEAIPFQTKSGPHWAETQFPAARAECPCTVTAKMAAPNQGGLRLHLSLLG